MTATNAEQLARSAVGSRGRTGPTRTFIQRPATMANAMRTTTVLTASWSATIAKLTRLVCSGASFDA